MALWSKQDDELLRSMYQSHDSDQIAAALGRTPSAVRTRVWTLKLSSKIQHWSRDEIRQLREFYARPFFVVSELAKSLGRTEDAVSLKASRLGIASAHHRRVETPKAKQRKFATIEEYRAHNAKRVKEQWATKGHPRGMAGKKHSPEVLSKLSDASRKVWADPTSKHHTPENQQRRSDAMHKRMVEGDLCSGGRAYSRCRKGARPDLGSTVFLSRWEANYARYLAYQQEQGAIASWAYEPRTFLFDKAKRGTRSYTPDFLVTYPDGRHEWHEVKGWMDEASKARIERLATFYPDEKLIVIDQPWFRALNRSGLTRQIAHWEDEAA